MARHSFDSFETFVDDVCQLPTGDISSRDTGREAHFGTPTFEAAIALSKTGWAAGADRVSQIRADLDQYLQSAKSAAVQQFAWDVTGDFVDVGRALAGEPEAFGTTNDYEAGRSGSQRVVRLYANLGVSAAVNAESIFARGAVVLAAVDLLESLGVRVELWAAKATIKKRGNAAKHQVEVLVKAANQPVDVDRLAYILCNASFLRRLCWSHQERFGYFPTKCYPAPLDIEDGCVKTSECRRGTSHATAELAGEVAKLCRECGIILPEGVTHG
jgi:hypothetical protein